jgi:hypothetical protein
MIPMIWGEIMSRYFRKTALVLSMLILAVMMASAGAQADCEIYGTIIAEPNPGDPDLGIWLYRLVVYWNTDVQYALSHLDLVLDAPGGSCTCAEIEEALNWNDPIGFSMESPGYCLIYYGPELLCHGEPSIPVPGTVLKFEPYESDDCEPGTGGVATFTIYSNYPPGDISEPNLLLVDKFGQLSCSGAISGQFPVLPCDPVASQQLSWGALRALYR